MPIFNFFIFLLFLKSLIALSDLLRGLPENKNLPRRPGADMREGNAPYNYYERPLITAVHLRNWAYLSWRLLLPEPSREVILLSVPESSRLILGR